MNLLFLRFIVIEKYDSHGCCANEWMKQTNHKWLYDCELQVASWRKNKLEIFFRALHKKVHVQRTQMVMMDTYNIRRACVCGWRGSVFLVAVPLSRNERLTKTSMAARWERESEKNGKKSSNCRCLQLTTYSWHGYRTHEWLAVCIFRWEIEKYSRENAVLSQRSLLFETTKNETRRCATWNSHFKNWPILLCAICESMLFYFLSSPLRCFTLQFTRSSRQSRWVLGQTYSATHGMNEESINFLLFTLIWKTS